MKTFTLPFTSSVSAYHSSYSRKTKLGHISMVLRGSNTIYSVKINYRVQKGKSGQVYASCLLNSLISFFHSLFPPEPADHVRLKGGSNTNEGRVEIYYDNAWSTVCDNAWDEDDATVVCRELGLPTSHVEAIGGASFGSGSGGILRDQVACTGSENKLLACPAESVHQCGHQQDAGVVCGGNDVR